MAEWFSAGGWVMWFIVLLGALNLAAALKFARFAEPLELPRLQSLARALAWAIVVGLASDLAAVGSKIPANPAWAHSPDLALLVLQGISESLVPVILGGSLLTVTALLTAAGHARLRLQGATP